MGEHNGRKPLQTFIHEIEKAHKQRVSVCL